MLIVLSAQPDAIAKIVECVNTHFIVDRDLISRRRVNKFFSNLLQSARDRQGKITTTIAPKRELILREQVRSIVTSTRVKEKFVGRICVAWLLTSERQVLSCPILIFPSDNSIHIPRVRGTNIWKWMPYGRRCGVLEKRWWREGGLRERGRFTIRERFHSSGV